MYRYLVLKGLFHARLVTSLVKFISLILTNQVTADFTKVEAAY